MGLTLSPNPVEIPIYRGGHSEHFSPAQPVHIAPNVPQLYKGTASDGGAHAPFKNHTQLSSLKWCSQVAFFASSVRLCYPSVVGRELK